MQSKYEKWDLPWFKSHIEGCTELAKTRDWRRSTILSSLQEWIWSSRRERDLASSRVQWNFTGLAKVLKLNRLGIDQISLSFNLYRIGLIRRTSMTHKYKLYNTDAYNHAIIEELMWYVRLSYYWLQVQPALSIIICCCPQFFVTNITNNITRTTANK